MASTVIEAYLYDLNLKRNGTNESGARVYIWDFTETNVVDVTTDVSGNIAQQTLQNQSISVAGAVETPTQKTPHRIAVLKYGMEIQSRDNVIAAPVFDPFFVGDDDFITEAVPATVAAYTGFAINHTLETITLDGTGITPVNTLARLYDRLQYEAVTTAPQFDFANGIMRTTDGVNYVLEYDLIINGFTFNGQSKTINFAVGKDITFGTVGRADDLAIIGNANWGTSTTLDNFDVSGTLLFTETVTATATDVQIGTVDTQGTPTQETVVLNILNVNEVSSIGTNADPTNITINNSVPINFKVTDATDGSNVSGARIFMEAGAGGPLTEGTDIIPGDVVTDVNGEYSTSFNYTSDQPVVGRIRKSSPGDTLYRTFSFTGTISGSGLTVNASLIRDE